VTVVLDASVVVAALIDDGSDGLWAEQVLFNGPLLSTQLMPAEVTNVLRRSLASGRIDPVSSGLAMSRLSELPVELFPFAPFAARVWVLRDNVTAYDAWYVAVAEAVGAPLATLDPRPSPGRGAGPRLPVRAARRQVTRPEPIPMVPLG